MAAACSVREARGSGGRVAEDEVLEVKGGQAIWGPPGHMKISGFYSEPLQGLEQERGII